MEDSTLLWLLSPGAQTCSHNKYQQKISSWLQEGIMFLTRHAPRRNQLTKVWLIEALSEPNCPGKGNCPTPINSSHLVPPKGEEKSWETLVKFTAQRHQIRSDQSLSRVRLFATPWIAARHASLSITNSRSSPRLTSIESVMPSSHLILCRPLLLMPPIPPSISLFQRVNSSHEVAKVLEFQL